MKLNAKQEQAHKNAVQEGKSHRRSEQGVIEALIKVEAAEVHKILGKSLFKYACEDMGLMESVALALISVARKAKVVPILRQALREQNISGSKASRIVAAITPENAEELIEFAKTHTSLETDFEVAKRNPKAKSKDKYKVISEDEVQITVTVKKSTFEKLKRVQSLEAQKGKDTSYGECMTAMADVYIKTNDPVKKAERNVSKNNVSKNSENKSHENKSHANQKKVCINRVNLTAAEKHAVFKRDQGKCTFHDHEGKRCNSDRWIDIHHIILRSQGGTNDPENLTTLCSFHHDLVHQLSMPIDGQFSWIR